MPEDEIWTTPAGRTEFGGLDDAFSAESEIEQAIALRDRGDLQGSLDTLRTLISQRTRRYGREGFETGCAISQLGRTLRAMGKLNEAAELHWEVLATRHQLYGFHSFTQRSAGILSDTLRLLGDHEMVEAIKIWAAQPEHPGLPALTAIARVTEQLNQTKASRQTEVHRRVLTLVDAYLKRQISLPVAVMPQKLRRSSRPAPHNSSAPPAP